VISVSVVFVFFPTTGSLLPQPSPRSPAFNALMVSLEWMALILQAVFSVYLLSAVVESTILNGPLVVLALLGLPLGFVAADLFTGFGHFFADNFCSVDTPILGHALVFRFRQHHEDQLIICNLSFRELNGGLALLMVPLLVLVAIVVPVSTTIWGAKLALFSVSMAFFGAGTNQIHRWAHDRRRPGWVVPFQKMGLFLSPIHHAVHHKAPHHLHFCITNGWLNPFLDRYHVWHRLADLILFFGVEQAPESVMGSKRQAQFKAAALAESIQAESGSAEPIVS
jgi:ubiquitin-conjugating enzyme E2 variant